MHNRYEKVRSWLFDHAWPFWLEAGVDRCHGGFVEYLDLAGRDGGANYKRTRAQARQIYCFSQAALLGCQGAAEVSDTCWAFLSTRARRADGGWACRLSREGAILDAASDAYDIAFVLFAHAWRYRLTSDNALIASAKATLDSLDHDLADPKGLGWYARPGDYAIRQQNPHMHMLEALLELALATGVSRFFELAERLVHLMVNHMFDQERGLLREFFGAGWQMLNDRHGRIVEPGHHYEWVWLLHRANQALGLSLGQVAEALYAFAERHGINPQTYLVYDEVDIDGRTIRKSSRSWPQTEALKAHLSMMETGNIDNSIIISHTIDNIFNNYLKHHPYGTWIDHNDDLGLPLSDKIPSTTLYHIQLSFTEFLRLNIL